MTPIRSVAVELGAFVASLQPARLPAAVLAAVRSRMLDFAGVAVAGQAVERVAPWIDYAACFARRPEATIIGRPERALAIGAALANAVAGGALELDDGHLDGHVHPGAIVIPAALAVAERDGRSAADFLAGVVAGYEIAIRVGEALTADALYRRGFNVMAVAGSFGAAAAAARARGLDAAASADALGHAALAPAAPMVSFQEGAMTRDGYWGWPGAVGVLAADLAARGVRGPGGIFEERWGLLHALADGGAPGRLTAGLGERWAILETYTKVHAACSHAQTALDAAADAGGGPVDPAEIASVQVDTYTYAAALREPAPATPAAAQFSIPFCLAVLLVTGRVGPEAFAPGGLSDLRLRALAGRVELREDTALEARHHAEPFCRPARVTVRRIDGRQRTAYREVARGWPQSPLSTAELTAKYRALAGRVLPERSVDALASAIGALEPDGDLTFVRYLAGAITADGRRPR